jgi:anthranilate phosphoribosyltransferase
MKNVAPVRRELGVRTIFNILGPLTNPAEAPNILMGVFHPDLVGIQVRVMEKLGARHALVVYGRDGMDEISLGAATMVGELKDGKITEYDIHPEDFGLAMISNRGLKVKDSLESREMVLEALGNVAGTPREIVILNAGTALYAADCADSIGKGIAMAREAIASGAARATASSARMVVAAARFSVTTTCPRRSAMGCATARVMMSMVPPAEDGTTMRSARVGNVWVFCGAGAFCALTPALCRIAASRG